MTATGHSKYATYRPSEYGTTVTFWSSSLTRARVMFELYDRPQSSVHQP